jgi:HTH-type transcriptional regulator/antitoxin HigA
MTVKIHPIRTEPEYRAALSRADELMDSKRGTSDGDHLDLLVKRIETYEAQNEFDVPSDDQILAKPPGRSP